MTKYIALIFILLSLASCTVRVYRIEIAGDCKEFKIEALVDVPKEISVNADGKLQIPLVP